MKGSRDGFFGKRGTNSISPNKDEQVSNQKNVWSKGTRASSALTAETKHGQSTNISTFPPTLQQNSRHGNQNSRLSQLSGSLSQSYPEDDVTVSKSLTDLADLPLPVPKQKQQAAMGWNDDGFDDWNFDDVKEDKKKSPIK